MNLQITTPKSSSNQSSNTSNIPVKKHKIPLND